MKTRRDFLKGSLAVGLGAALAPLAKFVPPEPVHRVIPKGKVSYPPVTGFSAVASGDYIDITTFGEVNQTYLLKR